MPSPSLTIPLSLALAGWWLPVLGLLLAGLGVGLVTVSMGELGVPVRTAGSAAHSTVAVQTIASRVDPPAPAASEVWTSRGDVALAAPVRSRRPADCLGADLATGQRVESMHLATVPVQRPAECGDVHDAVLGLASLSHIGRDVETDSAPSAFAGAALSEVDGLDLTAATLYGPPDRQPQATQEVLLEEGGADGGRGRARNYLEETAASRLLAPR